jgi:hypothetical protein
MQLVCHDERKMKMSNYDWNKGYQNTQNGGQTAPQRPNESADAFKDRVAGAEQARKDQQNK